MFEGWVVRWGLAIGQQPWVVISTKEFASYPPPVSLPLVLVESSLDTRYVMGRIDAPNVR